MIYKLTIEGSLPGLNEYTSACRTHAQNGARMKRKAQEWINFYIYKDLRKVKVKSPATLSFKWYEKNRKRDLDNVAFAKKFILDALVHAEVLEGDGWKDVAGFKDEFYIDKENPRIEVEIREIK